MATTLNQPKVEDAVNNTEQTIQDEQSTESSARQQSSLYVGDLAKDVVENQLYELFSQVGPVLSLRICKDQVTKRSLGYGYVNFNSAIDPQAAQKALDNLNYKAINGKPIRIMWSNRDPQFRKSGVGNIFIKNLDKSIDNQELHDTFKQFGSILSCKVATDEQGNSKGYGFVHFINETDARYAIENVNDMQIKGKTVYVGPFQKSFERATEQKIFTNIYVKNLKEGVTDEQLNEIFAQYGEVTSAVVAKDSGKVKGFGFVNFKLPEHAAKAVNELHDRPHEKLTYPSVRLYANRAEKKNEREAKLRQIRDDKINEVHQKTVGMNVYVKNLSDGMTNERLKSLFSRFGEITSAKIMTDQQTRSKGFGFVCFSNPDAAASAVVEMYGFMVDNKPLYVAHAQRKDVRRAQLSNFKKMQSMQMNNPVNRQVPNYGATPAPMPFAPTSFMGYPQPLPGAAGRGMMPPYAYQAPMQPPTGGREGRLGGRGGMGGRGAPIPPQAQAMGAPMMGGIQQIPRGMGGRGGPMGYGRGRQNLNFRNSGRGFQGRGGRYQGGRRPMPYGRGRGGVVPNQMYNRNIPNQLQAGQGLPPQTVQPTPLQKIQVNDQNNGNQGNQADLVQTLATKSEDEQKQVIGEKIYKQVQKAQPLQAGKITGMLLEMGVSEVLSLLESPSQLQERIDEAINVLKKANMYEPSSGQNGNVQPPQAQTA